MNDGQIANWLNKMDISLQEEILSERSMFILLQRKNRSLEIFDTKPTLSTSNNQFKIN